MTAQEDELWAIPVDDSVRANAGRVVEPPVDPQLELLPTNMMDWEDFERLLLDLGRDQLGLRSLSFFGKRGQAQKGLDIVGTNADGRSEGVQSKRYQAFSVADLDAAVEKYTRSTLPFRLVRFVIGVSAKVDDRPVVERKTVLNEALHPLEIDIWDQSRISEMLRDKPEIVIKYFGERAAERFCVPHVLIPVEVAGPDAVATADAVLLGPLRTVDAEGLLTTARSIASDDPARALALYREVQNRLRSSGFPGHATEFDDTVAQLCVRIGDERAAIRLLLDALWAAESADDSLRADEIGRILRALAGFPEFGSAGTEAPRTPSLGAAFTVAQFVADHLHAPVPTRIDLPADAVTLSEAIDRARVVLFAAERALGNDDLAWIIAHRKPIESAAAEVATTHIDVSVRLQLTVADATGDWAALIHSARTRMQRELKALVLARHARYQALLAAFTEADGEWSEAIGEACLAQRHDDAADWLYSQRFIDSRCRGTLVDTWHPVAQALSNLPSRPRLVSTAGKSRERALSALHYDKPRVAAVNLRRQLLDGVRSASFHDELEARRLLGQLYRETGDLPLAAYYSIQGGDPQAARSTAAAFEDNYHDVADLMKGSLSWVVASALQFATEQADLIPDDEVDVIIELALDVIRDVMSGMRLDSPLFSPHMYLSAYGLLVALAGRLSAAHARIVLDLLADSVAVEKEHQYHRTDESHIEIMAGIARAHAGELRDIALDQLLGLFEREAHPFRAGARTALTDNLDRVGARLQAMADQGHHDAAALLGHSDPDQVSTDTARDAAERLRQPTMNGPIVFGTGTGAVNDSLLAVSLPAEERIACIEMLMSNAASPWEGSDNREDYLLAASNLVDGLDDEHRRRFLDVAIDFAAHPPASQADTFNASMSSPLGGMHIDARTDCRPAAAFLAARLAKSPQEQLVIRDSALRLIGANDDGDFRVTKTLQIVKIGLGDSIGMLARGSWTLRCLAAILWSEMSDASNELGTMLCRDSDAECVGHSQGHLLPGMISAVLKSGRFCKPIRGGQCARSWDQSRRELRQRVRTRSRQLGGETTHPRVRSGRGPGEVPSKLAAMGGKQTKDQQVKHIVEGMALGVLSEGVTAVTSAKVGFELAFNHAWRRWKRSGQFPSLKGHDPGNVFWIGVGKSARRKVVRAAWRSGQWSEPYIVLDGWTVEECLELHSDERAAADDWKRLGRLFIEHFEPEQVCTRPNF